MCKALCGCRFISLKALYLISSEQEIQQEAFRGRKEMNCEAMSMLLRGVHFITEQSAEKRKVSVREYIDKTEGHILQSKQSRSSAFFRWIMLMPVTGEQRVFVQAFELHRILTQPGGKITSY